MPKLVTIITAYNRADFVGRCVNSVLRAAGPALDIAVIVMDNGSSDGTAEAAREAGGDRVEVIRTEDNRPIVGVINRGFATAYEHEDADYILVLNDDTAFTQGSLERLMAAAEAHPHAVLTPMQLNYRRPHELDDNALGHVVQVRCLIEDAVLCRPLEQVYPLPTIIGAAMLARRDVWDAIGEFDENFWFYGIDDDICTRARWLGGEILLVPAAHLLHAHGKLGSEPNQNTFSKPLEKWCKELQARYMFLLKDPAHSLPWNFLRAFKLATSTCCACALGLWPAGAWHAWRVYFACVGQRRRIAEARRRHFNLSRRIR